MKKSPAVNRPFCYILQDFNWAQCLSSGLLPVQRKYNHTFTAKLQHSEQSPSLTQTFGPADPTRPTANAPGVFLPTLPSRHAVSSCRVLLYTPCVFSRLRTFLLSIPPLQLTLSWHPSVEAGTACRASGLHRPKGPAS